MLQGQVSHWLFYCESLLWIGEKQQRDGAFSLSVENRIVTDEIASVENLPCSDHAVVANSLSKS